MNTISDTIAKGLEYISHQQLADGSFLSYTSYLGKLFKPIKQYKSPFATALIIQNLSLLERSQTKEVTGKAITYLKNQTNLNGSYNYWDKDSAEYREQPYPNDLDDTAVCLSALLTYDALDPELLAKLTRLLTKVETSPGGPYKTWLIEEDPTNQWSDTDLAVNANLGYLLKQLHIELPPLTKYLNTAPIRSRYYPDNMSVYYLLSRLALANQRNTIGQQAKVFQKKREMSPLVLALNTLCLCSVGSTSNTIEKNLTQLQSMQQPDGSWSVSGYCLDPEIKGERTVAGSPALTTSFCLLALSQSIKPVASHLKKLSVQHNQILTRLPESPLLAESVKSAITQVMSFDGDHLISQLVNRFNQSLVTPIKDQKIIDQLTQAHLLGWVSYTIFDDFLDEEGKPDQLPAAIWCQRESVRLFQLSVMALNQNGSLVEETFELIDAANLWELTNCRFDPLLSLPNKTWPEFELEQLAHRSIGHALACLILDQGANTEQLKAGFTAYLAAKQLNDDAHDWQEDLLAGRVTAATATLLSDLPRESNETIKELLPEIEILYWKEQVPIIACMISKYCLIAKNRFLEVGSVRDQSLFEQMLKPLELAGQTALDKHGEGKQFIRSYYNDLVE